MNQNQQPFMSYQQLMEKYGERIFRDACALSKTSPLSMQELCEKLQKIEQDLDKPKGGAS